MICLGIGTIIGHEITHGFDDQGQQFDKNRKNMSWWTSATIDQFNNRKKCIVDQYSNFTVPKFDIKVHVPCTQS
jgi:neprilysin